MAVAVADASGSGARLCAQLIGRIRNQSILHVMRRVKRESFLDRSMFSHAGDNAALPIGHAQTTSSPFVIARMLEMLLHDLSPPATILEVGVGCGYQTALLAELGYTVIGVERVKSLADAARKRLQQMNYDNVQVFHDDGLSADKQTEFYDGMILCAECAQIPEKLLPRLSATGHLVLPLKRRGQVRLTAVDASGNITALREAVNFVPMKEGIE